ncbi:MAG: hypothetical protein ACREFD_17420 [Stellaceae bacterium]
MWKDWLERTLKHRDGLSAPGPAPLLPPDDDGTVTVSHVLTGEIALRAPAANDAAAEEVLPYAHAQ